MTLRKFINDRIDKLRYFDNGDERRAKYQFILEILDRDDKELLQRRHMRALADISYFFKCELEQLEYEEISEKQKIIIEHFLKIEKRIERIIDQDLTDCPVCKGRLYRVSIRECICCSVMLR